jgi:hypothetical protein
MVPKRLSSVAGEEPLITRLKVEGTEPSTRTLERFARPWKSGSVSTLTRIERRCACTQASEAWF